MELYTLFEENMKNGIHILKEHTIAEAAYLAGIIDGEGSIYIGNFSRNPTTGAPYYQTVIEVSSTDKCLIEWLSEIFGGRFSKYTKNQLPGNSRKPAYKWMVTGILIDHLIKLAYPYIVIKKDQCDIMLQMRETYKETGMRKGKPSNERVPDHIMNLRAELFKKLRLLHCRNYTDK
jgi:hypothetical protein